MELSNPGSTLILGGARSGKSRFAEKLVTASGLSPFYVATGRSLDGEMDQRISQHKARRGPEWTTIEEPVELATALKQQARTDRAILVDCLTLWVTNLMMDGQRVAERSEALADGLANLPGAVVLVSNEVGLGIVPDNKMAREFRDHAGYLHQRIADQSDRVFFVAAGLPLKMKG
jgi:adenosylcobinamide kinase/adenosylcobinamide-phosphate guanylyltransferase